MSTLIGKKVIIHVPASSLTGYVAAPAKVLGEGRVGSTGDWHVILESDGQRLDVGSQEITEVFREKTPEIKRMERYLRREDMSPDGKLCMVMEDDGDICLSVISGNGGRNTGIQFCTVGSGGGKSRHTLEALRNLMQAIHLDNEENPL